MFNPWNNEYTGIILRGLIVIGSICSLILMFIKFPQFFAITFLLLIFIGLVFVFGNLWWSNDHPE